MDIKFPGFCLLLTRSTSAEGLIFIAWLVVHTKRKKLVLCFDEIQKGFFYFYFCWAEKRKEVKSFKSECN